MVLGEHQSELALGITERNMQPSGGLMQEGANPSASQGDPEIMPRECQEEGGISEKESGAGRTEKISTERTAKGSPERRKGSLKSHVTRAKATHTRLQGFLKDTTVWRMKTQLSST